jgi:hypothetical protein
MTMVEFHVLPQYFPERTEENKKQSRELRSQPRFELNTPQILVRSATISANLLGLEHNEMNTDH